DMPARVPCAGLAWRCERCAACLFLFSKIQLRIEVSASRRAAEERDELAPSHDGHGVPPLPLCTGVTGVERSSPDTAAVSLSDVQPATEWPAGPGCKLRHQYIRR